MFTSRYVVSANFANSLASHDPKFHTPFGRGRSGRSSKSSRLLYRSTPRSAEAASMPPTNFGYRRRSLKMRPEKTRSGLKTKEKSLPAFRPLTASSAGAKRARVVPTGKVVSYETIVPGFKPFATVAVASSIQPKSGTPSLLTYKGTTMTTASLCCTEPGPSRVAVRFLRITADDRSSFKPVSPGKGSIPSLTCCTVVGLTSTPNTV